MVTSNRKAKYCWLIVTAVIMNLTCVAQNLTLSIAKKSISFNENAIVTLTGELSNFNNYASLPEVDGLVVTNRTASFSLNKSNGRIKITQTFTLQPIRPGSFEIGAAYIESGSRRIYSNKVDLTVEQAEANANNTIVFLRCEPNKSTVFYGEMITLTLRLYHRADINFSGDRPYAHSFSGFWYQEGSGDGLYEDTVITQNGLKYVGETLYKEYVFPNLVGELYLPKYEYMCYINFYGADANSLSADQQVELVSAPVKITSLALPEHDTLMGYNEDVGSFKIKTALSATATNTYEPVQFIVTITGSGNFPFMMAPTLHLPDGMKATLIDATDSTITLFNYYNSQKKFTYNLVPEQVGDFNIEPFTFTYFDPEKEKYITLSDSGYTLHVELGEKLTEDSESNLPTSFFDVKADRSKPILLGVVAVLLIGGAVFFWNRTKKKKENHTKELLLAKQKAAEEQEYIAPIDSSHKQAMALVSNATMILQNGQVTQTVNALYEALTIRICGVAKMRREEISVNTLKYKLTLIKLEASQITELMELYEELKLKRYMLAPADYNLAGDLILRTSALLQKLVLN